LYLLRSIPDFLIDSAADRIGGIGAQTLP